MTVEHDPRICVDPPESATKQKASEAIFHALRLEIAFGQLKPRERLIEHDLCKRFGTSNHNVRQAFELLDRVGLVERRANRGVEVKALTAVELNDLYEVRVLLQAEGARKIDLSRADDIVAALTAINARYAAALQSGRIEDAALENDAFHTTTFDYCTNADLAALQRTYWLKASAVISRALTDQTLSQASVQDHLAIIAAIGDRDVERFVTVAVNHIQPAVDVYRRIYGLT